MEKELELTILFDIYEGILSSKQKIYFKEYYFENNSLSEISENLNVSKNAVSKSLAKTSKDLYYFENQLKLMEKNKLLEMIKSLNKNEKITKLLERL
ncbi:MAG: hypothetical protein ACK5HL_01945 [Bacilli bacterium]